MDRHSTTQTEKKADLQDELVINNEFAYSEKNPLLSVVIPVFNVEKYIERCLESVIKQTYRNIEIICVNDCSAENEEEIIKDYCAGDSRIKYVRHSKNMGLFQARITGMKYASGSYFAFLDSDDHLSSDYYRLLMKKITESDADIVIGDFIDEYENGKTEYYNYDNVRFADIDLRGGKVYETFMSQRGFWFGWHTVWNKIYSMEIWKKSIPYLSRFSEEHGHLIMTEDIAYSCTFWRFADSVVNAHNAFYYYYHHSGQSVANANLKKFKKNVTDVAAVFDYFENLLKQENLWERFETDYNAFKDLYIEFWTGNADAVKPDEDREKGRAKVKELFGKTEEKKYKDHFHYSLRTEIPSFKWYEEINKSICSPEIKVVSFDIFDTLLLRPFFSPSDIFCLMNSSFNEMVNGLAYVDFRKIRINTEAELRRNLSMGEEEVTLDDIYDGIADIFALTKQQRQQLKELEIQLELKYIRPRKCGKELYELARYMNKRIICTSDIYLPSEAVREMLKKCGYEPDEIYLSSEYLVSKHTGNLYKIVIKKEKCKSGNIVHIGDNWDSDVTAAQNIGVVTHHLSAPVAQFKGENGGIFSGASYGKIFCPTGKQYMGENAAEFMGIRCMLALTANKIFDNPYVIPFNKQTDFNANAYFIGYYALGMHLFAVADWIADIAEKEKRETVHFVSRDGYLPMKAFELLKKYRKISAKSSYMYISRKATAVLQGAALSDMEAYINSFSSSSISIKTPIDTFSIVAKDNMRGNIRNLSKCKLMYYGVTDSFSETAKVSRTIFSEYIDSEKVKNYIELSGAYFDKTIGKNDILFDLGYRANKEYILSRLLKRPVDCLYIYSNESGALERNINAGFTMRTFYNYTPSAFAAARELMFSELAPSCVGYDCEKDMKPIFDEEYEEHYFNRFIIRTMQNAALDFIADFEDTFSDTIIPELYRGFDASLPFEFYLNHSQYTDRSVFSCVTFEDDTFAGKPSRMIDDWEKAIVYHKLYGVSGEKEYIRGDTVYVPGETVYLQQEIPQELREMYADGMFMKLYRFLNKKYPGGSKKRERIKKIAGMFLK